MKKKQYYFLLFSILLYANSIYAQVQDSCTTPKPKLRTVFFTLIGAGYPEILNLRLGWQINEEWSAAVKASIYRTPGGYSGGSMMYNLQAARFFPDSKIGLNNISLAATYYYQHDRNRAALELYTGWEGVYDYFQPYIAVGFTYINILYLNTHWNNSSTELLDTPYGHIMAGVKAGFNINI